MLKYFFIFGTLFLSTIKQKPTPQLNVVNISMSEIFLFFNHLKILWTLIFERSIFTVKLLGTDLVIFSIRPPPVMWADELIKPLLTKVKISFKNEKISPKNAMTFADLSRVQSTTELINAILGPKN